MSNRKIVKPGQVPLDTDILELERFYSVGIGRLAQSVMGPVAVADGLAVTATSPASMQVKVGAGSLYLMGVVDANDFGTLSADSTPVYKQAELETDTLITLTAPVTFGQSINYLIQATMSEVDDTPLVRPYYNAADPSAPFSGPSGSGVTDYTVRRSKVVLSAKAGASAATGSQTTPTADAGYVPLYVVSVAYGATTITSPSINVYGVFPAAPYLITKLPDVPSVTQSGVWIAANDTGSAGAMAIALSPIPLAYPKLLIVKAAATSVGATTIAVNGLTAVSVVNTDGTAIIAGQILSGMMAALMFDGTRYQLINPAAVNGASGMLLPCRAISVTNITLSGTQTVDGVALGVGDRCMVNGQTTGGQNGPYVVQAGAWVRATDFNGQAQAKGGIVVVITEGTNYADTLWELITDDAIVFGTTALKWGLGTRSLGFYSNTGAISLPDSIWTRLSPSSVTGGALGQSTFSNGVFTCGAAEAGWWIFSLEVSFDPVTVSNFSAMVGRIAGPYGTVQQHNVQGSGNQGNAANCTLITKLAAADQVTFDAFHLTGYGNVYGVIGGMRISR